MQPTSFVFSVIFDPFDSYYTLLSTKNILYNTSAYSAS
jgi:hypothetical protein